MEQSAGSSSTISKPVRILVMVFIVICAFLAIVTTIYALFFNVGLVDKTRSEEIHQIAVKRMKANDAYPRDENGFVVLEAITNNNANQARVAPYKVLSKYIKGTIPETTRELLKDKKSTEKDIKEFISVLPVIEKAINKKSYVIPSRGEYGLNPATPDFLTMRAIAQGLEVLGLYYEMQGRPIEAAKCYLLAIDYGVKIGHSGMLITQMISIAIQQIGITPLHYLLAGGKLKSSQYREIIARLESLPLNDDDFLNAMDEEYARCINGINDIMAGRNNNTGSIPGANLTKVKFLIEREKKFYMNVYLECRPAFVALKLPEEIGVRNLDEIHRELCRKKSLLTSILIPNYTRALMNKKNTLTGISGLKILAALQAYKIEQGEYPAALEELCPGYLKTLPLDYMSSDGSLLRSMKTCAAILKKRQEMKQR